MLPNKGDYIGFKLVEKLAQEKKIHLRTGCFCNIGACQAYLQHLNQEKNFFFSHGHKCGDHIDLVDGKPTGAIRVSLGYCSIQRDCDNLVQFLASTFLETSERSSIKSCQVILTMPIQRTVYFKITNMFIYPVKSCSAMKIESKWPLSERSGGGFLYDREWMIVDGDHVPLSQKRTPGLTCLRPVVDLDRKILSISYAGADDFIEISLDTKLLTPWAGRNELRG